jgi:glycerol-3-phosphate dehydrogenase (NAD(P)+)
LKTVLDDVVGIDKGAMQVAVLGAGSWGTVLAVLLAANGHQVRLWARDAAHASALDSMRENRRYLPDVPLAPAIAATADLEQAVAGASVVTFAVPSGGLRQVATAAADAIEPDAVLLSATKGLEEGTGLRMSQVLAQTIADAARRVVALSGPNLAVEMARGVPTASVAAADNPSAARAVQRLFARQSPPVLRVYTGNDVIGVELGGAVKNVIAIGAGICDGLGYGDNAKAALMTRGLAEAVRLGVAQGAKAETFMGLSGVGDLIATGASRLSRNYRVGFALGQGQTLAAILAELGQVAEGAPTTHVLCELARRSGVEMPLCEALYRVLFAGQRPPDIIRELMLRPLKEEGQKDDSTDA